MAANRPSLSTTCAGDPASPVAASSAGSWPIAAARRATSAAVRPQHTVWPAEYTSDTGSRPAAAQASRTRPNAAPVSSGLTNTTLYSSANLAASRGVVPVADPRRRPRGPARPGPADQDRRARALHRLGQRGRLGQRVVGPAEGVRLAHGCLPQPGDDLELLLQPAEPLGQAGERDPVGAVLRVEPAGPQPQLDPARAHLVHLGDRYRQRPGIAEGRRADQGAEPDPPGLAGPPG